MARGVAVCSSPDSLLITSNTSNGQPRFSQKGFHGAAVTLCSQGGPLSFPAHTHNTPPETRHSTPLLWFAPIRANHNRHAGRYERRLITWNTSLDEGVYSVLRTFVHVREFPESVSVKKGNVKLLKLPLRLRLSVIQCERSTPGAVPATSLPACSKYATPPPGCMSYVVSRHWAVRFLRQGVLFVVCVTRSRCRPA